MAVDADWPFVGRQSEFDEAQEHLAAGRSVLIAGPAGVGKTQLARALIDTLEPARSVIRIAGSISSSVPPRSIWRSTSIRPVLAVDDIHLLDADAAALVGSLTVEGEVQLIATLRIHEPTAPAVTTLWKDDHVIRIDLDDLARAEIDQILDEVLVGPIDVNVRWQLWDLTRGSPLFLRELVRSALADGSLVETNGMWHLTRPPHSGRIDDLISDRLDALGPDGAAVVELVALGEPLGFDALVRTMGVEPLDEAERCGLVEAVMDERRQEVRLVHPVFGDVVRRRIGAARTALRYAQLVQLLETTPMRRLDDIVRSATWQLRADGTVVTDAMVVAARRALYDSNELLAIELASRVADDGRPDAVLVLSEALAGIGEHRRADLLLSELGGTVVEGDLALVAIQRAVTLYWGLNDAQAAEQILLDAELQVTSPTWRDEVRAERAVIIATQGHVGRAMDLASELVEAPTSDRVFVTAAIAAAVSMTLDGRCQQAYAIAERAFGLGAGMVAEPGMSDPTIHLVAQALALSESGSFDASETLARAAHAHSAEQGMRHGQAWFALVLGRTLLMRGAITDARRHFVESAASFAWLHSDGPRRWALAGVVLSAVMSGNREQATAAKRELDTVPDHPARMMGIEVERAGAWIHVLEPAGRARAIDELTSIARNGIDTGQVSLAAGAAHDVVRLGGTIDDGALWDRIATVEGTLGAARADLGRVATSGDASIAARAAASFEEMGAHLFAAEAWELVGDLHEAAGATRAATGARAAAGAAQRRAGDDWAMTLGVVRTVGPSELTTREHEVAALAAAGRTNRQIADELFVSIRTVENHLQHVYDRLGITGRRDLADALRRS